MTRARFCSCLVFNRCLRFWRRVGVMPWDLGCLPPAQVWCAHCRGSCRRCLGLVAKLIFVYVVWEPLSDSSISGHRYVWVANAPMRTVFSIQQFVSRDNCKGCPCLRHTLLKLFRQLVQICPVNSLEWWRLAFNHQPRANPPHCCLP